MKPFLHIIVLLANCLVHLNLQAVELTIDGAKRYQEIEGFGTALISWSDFPKEVYTDDFADFYVNDVGLSMLRMAIGHFQHPPAKDGASISWRYVAPDTRGQVFVDFARKLKQRNPNVRLVGTVWSPPNWLKMNNAQGNGSQNRQNEAIRAHSYENKTNRIAPGKLNLYVSWLAAVVKWHEENDIPLYAVSPANEPRFSQWYESCVFTAEDLAIVIGKLGVELKNAGLGNVKIFGPEDMTGHMFKGGTKSMIEAIKNNPEAWRELDRIATHGYTDGIVADVSKQSSLDFQNFISGFGKPYWMTEGGTRGHSWPVPITSGIAQALHNALVGGNASAFLPWQISEREPSTHALAVYSSPTKKTYTAMHYFRSIPVGSHRIEAKPAFGTIQTSAFFDSDTGELAIIIVNPSSAPQDVTLRLANLAHIQSLKPRRTTKDENFVDRPPIHLLKGSANLTLLPQSIISLTANGKE